MSEPAQSRYSRGLSIILVLFTLVYALGLVYLLLSWLGIQSFDPAIWQPDSLPIYMLVFLIGTVSLYGIWKGKKWGVYGLASTWVLTGLLNLVFALPTPNRYTFLAFLLVIILFLLLRPAWRKMV